MKSNYRHTQYGALMFIVFLLTGILIAAVALMVITEGRTLPAVLMVLVYLLGLVLFSSFTVEVSEENLRFWFGIGVIRKTITLREVQSTKEIQNPWYYFWGVKSIPGGWFYAIAPGTAVEIKLKNGGILQLGTNQPKKLKQAIDAAKQRMSKK
ncbi:MAG: hypothetical protein CL609_03650 [Anaerolineaceae bacterium]|nr:hypothetical protein [Anaerolineaceae bacterium]